MKNSEIICLFFKFISVIIYLTRQISCVDCQENKREHRPNMSHKSEGEKMPKILLWSSRLNYITIVFQKCAMHLTLKQGLLGSLRWQQPEIEQPTPATKYGEMKNGLFDEKPEKQNSL